MGGIATVNTTSTVRAADNCGERTTGIVGIVG
jgi:hypothetical protein